jgi:type VI secretion system protein ImpK
MLERSQNSYPLLRQFREFYEVVARLRRTAESAAYSGETAQPIPGRLPAQASSVASLPDHAAQSSASSVALVEGVDPTTLQVWREMALYLDQKMYEVKLAASSLTHDFLEELVYLMAAFADETFACLVDWSGRDYWSEHWMESRLFNSQIAGEDIFRRIDSILTRQDYGAEELSSIYLMVLALGYRGQYLRDPAAVDVYRKRLFDRLLMTNPDLRRDSLRLFPEAYRHTISEGAPVQLPEPRKWWLVVAGIVAAWLVISTIAWLSLTRSTEQTLHATMRALEKVRNRETRLDASTKWRPVAFTLQNGTYRLTLPSSLPKLASSASGVGSAVAPFVLAINGPGGFSAGTPAQLQSWLSRGSTTFPADLRGALPTHRMLASIEAMPSPPTGVMASNTTLFVWVDPGLSAQELALRPQLTFPINGDNADGNRVSVAAISLYLPVQSAAVAQ